MSKAPESVTAVDGIRRPTNPGSQLIVSPRPLIRILVIVVIQSRATYVGWSISRSEIPKSLRIIEKVQSQDSAPAGHTMHVHFAILDAVVLIVTYGP